MAALDVAAPVRPVPLDAMASLEEWLADPAGASILREVVGTDESGRPRGIVGDHELRAVVGNFPIGALAAFPGSGLDQGTVDELLRRLPDRRAP
jgi:beta-glucosidase